MMKYLVCLLVFGQLGFTWANDPGDPVFITPRVWHFSNSVQVDVWNTTETDIECTGSVYIYTQDGRTQYEYYWETIYAGFSRNRTYYLRDFNDRITHASSSIRCRER